MEYEIRNTKTDSGETIMLQRAQELRDQLVKWRRAIHQHPEVGFAETHTAALVADELRKLRLRV